MGASTYTRPAMAMFDPTELLQRPAGLLLAFFVGNVLVLLFVQALLAARSVAPAGREGGERSTLVDEERGRVRCPDCTAENDAGYRFCRECLSELPGGARFAGGGWGPVRRSQS